MMKPSQVLIKIYTYPMPLFITNVHPWDGPKVFEERLVTTDEAKNLKDEWIRLGDFVEKREVEEHWKTVFPNLCEECKKYDHICVRCLVSLGDEWNQPEEYGDSIELLSNSWINCLGKDVDNRIYFNTMKLEVITDTKIIEAFKMVHPKGFVRSYSIFDDICRRQEQRAKNRITSILVRYYPDRYHNNENGIFRGRTGIIFTSINGRKVAIGFDVENDGKIKMPIASQISLLDENPVLKGIFINVRWRNGNHDPVTCDEYLKMVGANKCIKSYPTLSDIDFKEEHRTRFALDYSTGAEIHVKTYPDPNKPSKIFRESTGAIYATIDNRVVVIGFDVENDGKIKIPTASQKSLLKELPLDIKWRNGNYEPVSCDEYLKMTTISKK